MPTSSAAYSNHCLADWQRILHYCEVPIDPAARLQTALSALSRALVADLPSGVQPEDQLKPPVKSVIEAAADHVEVFTEARIAIGRPDAVARVRRAVCGHIELKEPGKGANPGRFRGADKGQWERFRALPNLIYTDGFDWSLYRSGERVDAIRAVVSPEGEIDRTASRKLLSLLTNFLQWEPIVATTPRALAEALAPLCRMLRDDVTEVLHDETSTLSALSAEIRQALFPYAHHRDFADTYAQTLTYALLLARLIGETQLTADAAVRRLQSGHRLLSEVLQHMAHPDARSEVRTAVDVLERVIGAVDPAKLARRGDPWIYFYEHFLEAYDPQLRKDRGVYYTPAEVIRCQVRLADELLRQRFGKPNGYAESGVVFLDPAAGTAAYPLAMIEHALSEVEQAWGAGMIPAAASELAKNVHAFEILVGPYAVAHLRISEVIRAAGGVMPPDGLCVYLTDTLESPNADAPSGGIFTRAMTDEHRRAIRVKRDVNVLVCMGNPPYDREQSSEGGDSIPEGDRKGGWVRFGDRESQLGRVGGVRDDQSNSDASERAILEDFLAPARAAGAGVHLKNVYNDYVYFWRWALWKLFENPRANGPGVISFITASSYLRGPGFVGMRQRMREAFDEIWIIDLGGDNLGARRTPNVFNIQTPVAIAIGARYGDSKPDRPARVRYARIDADTRESKLEKVGNVVAFDELEWSDCLSGWQQPFLPQGRGEYFDWPLLTDLFPWQHSGVQYKRTWPIAENREVIERRWQQLLAGDVATRRSMFKETRDRKIGKRYPILLPNQDRTPIENLDVNAALPEIRTYSYRSFDRQYCLADARVGDFLRGDIWRSHSSRQVYMTSLLSGVLGEGPAATVVGEVPDLHCFCGRGGKDVIPLWRDANCVDPNVTHGLLELLRDSYGRAVTSEEFFAYTYAVLATPRYVAQFAEELANPGPRVPITRNKSLFREAAALGRTLVNLHTFGTRFGDRTAQRNGIPQGSARLKRSIPESADEYPAEFSYETETQTLRVGRGEIAPVSPEVFEFSVSGFAVVKSWLSYRMSDRAGRASSALDRLRPLHWTRDMSRELLDLIWILEATVARFPQMADVFERIIAGPCFRGDELPSPTADQRVPAASFAHEDSAANQVNFDL